MEIKAKINYKKLPKSTKYLVLNKNFRNNQNYITKGESIKLLNYYAFNNEGRIVLYSSYENMEVFLNQKLKEFFILSIVLGILAIVPFFGLFYIFIFFYILIIWSFVSFLFNFERYNYKYFLDKDIYVIFRKTEGYDLSYLNIFTKKGKQKLK